MAQPINRHEVERAFRENDARRRVTPLREASLLAGRRPYVESEVVTRVGSDVTVTEIVSKPLVHFEEEATERMLGERCVVGRELAYSGIPERYLGLLVDGGGQRRAVVIERLPAGVLHGRAQLAATSPDAWLGTHIRHLNLIPLLKMHEADGVALAASSFLLGETLARLRADGNRPPLPIAVAIIAGVLDALHAAHGAADSHAGPLEIVHGGLGPHSILVGTDGVARVLGFGWARNLGSRDKAPAGTPGYAAPEQVFDQHATVHSDIFAVGVLLWECLTGRPLIEGESAVDGLLKFLAAGARPPSRFNPSVPKGLEVVTLCALESAPERRFQSAAEFASALLACVQPATAPEVAHYVQGVAWSALERRRSVLSNLESGRVALASGPAPQSRRQSGRMAAVVLAKPPAPVFEMETEEPTHLRIERVETVEAVEAVEAVRAEEPPPPSHWSTRDPEEATAVDGPRRPLPIPELLDAVGDAEPTDLEAALSMKWVQPPPKSIEPVAASESPSARRTEAPARLQNRRRSMQRVLVLAASLILVFFGAFVVGSVLRERRLPLGFMAPPASTVAAPAQVPSVQEPSPVKAPAPSPTVARVAPERSSASARASGVPVVRLEDLPLAGGSASDSENVDKASSKRDARRKSRARR